MGRRRTPILVALLAAASLCAGAVSTTSAAPPSRPNVVVLMTDDQTVESLRVMPNVERLLVDQGATFDNSFVSFPLCCPSRATFLTGQYAHNHGVLSNTPPGGGYRALDGAKTLPVWLRRAGYATAHVGKYLNGYGKDDPTEVPPGWTEWHGSVDPSSYRYFGYTLNENGRLVKYGHRARAYKTDVYADLAVDVVRRRAAAKQPFFLWVSFLAPHSGGPQPDGRVPGAALPAPRHRGTFASEPLPRPPSFNEADISDKPGNVRVRPLLDSERIWRTKQRYRLRLESLLAVDEAVARVVRALRESGELENTLIVFTSDNGFLQGEHRIPIGKIALYEPATRVPLVLRGPGIRPGLRLRQDVANVDLAPTILEAAGGRASLRMDGESLWPMLRDPGVYRGRDLLHEGPGTTPGVLQFTVLRTPRWVYARHFSGAAELYDLASDPDQLANLARDPAYGAVRTALQARLTSLASCVGDACRSEPQLDLAVEVEGACPEGAAEVVLTGDDAPAVASVRFLVDGRQVDVARRQPFAIVQPLVSAPALVRAHVSMVDGRELTQDRALPVCR